LSDIFEKSKIKSCKIFFRIEKFKTLHDILSSNLVSFFGRLTIFMVDSSNNFQKFIKNKSSKKHYLMNI